MQRYNFVTRVLVGVIAISLYHIFIRIPIVTQYHDYKDIEVIPINLKIDAIPQFKIIEMTEAFKYKLKAEHYQCGPDDLEIVAKTVWGEARGCSQTEQAAVVWCILNRVDSPDFPNNIIDVVMQKNQFSGYRVSNPVDTNILNLVQDVCLRWILEGTMDVGSLGRVLPKEYCWFKGDGTKNIFRDKYKGGNIWNWALYSPYGS